MFVTTLNLLCLVFCLNKWGPVFVLIVFVRKSSGIEDPLKIKRLGTECL